MNRGEVVTIYEDWITCLKPEGKAKLTRFVKSDWGFGDGNEIVGAELWYVTFIGREDEGEFQRWIKEPKGENKLTRVRIDGFG